jgi:D-sedoheptulose 7-phosphate isomerase
LPNPMILAEIEKTISVFRDFAASSEAIVAVDAIGNACGEALLKGGKILLAGNGGSAADAQHIAAEFVSRLQLDRLPLPAIALTTDTSILTAVANDYGYEKVFQRQIDALGKPGDVLIAISTSGNSPSILEALCAAKRKGIFGAGLTGQTGGKMAGLCDALVKVPSTRTQNIQEVHIMVGHTLCAMAERIYLDEAESPQRVRPASVTR